MTIGIDGNEANVNYRVGSSTYTLNLLKYFQKNATDSVRFNVFLRHRPLHTMPHQTKYYRYIIIPGPFAWSQFWLPLYLFFIQNIDVFFAPAHYIPRFCPVPVVVTIHDLAYFYYPDEFLKQDLYKLQNWTKYAVDRAQHVISVSKTTKKDIMQFYGIAENKITVIYNGYEKTENKPDTSILTKWSLNEKKYILYVGTLQPRKNIKTLMHAFNEFNRAQPDFKLVITGKKGWMYESIIEEAQLLDNPDSVIFTDYISDEKLSALYTSAYCFVLPSLYEGFGIPILEAMSFGCPVLASHSSSLPEVGGEACIYFDPTNANDLLEKLNYMFQYDAVRTELIEKGLRRINQFSWDACGKQTLDILQYGNKSH